MLNRTHQVFFGAVRTLREEGLVHFARRGVRWLGGERRFHMTPVVLQDHLPTFSASTQVVTVCKQAVMPLSPLVTVIIPVFNALDYVKRCLESLILTQTEISYEIVLVDNGSSPETQAWLSSFAQLHANTTLLRVSSNVGYGAGMNIGSRYGRGEFFLLSNSDVLFTKGSIQHLIEALRADESIGVCSPLTNYVGEGDQIALDAKNLKPEAAEDYARQIQGNKEVVFVPERLAFFCVAIRKTIFRLLNGFDEQYSLGNYEDEDLGARTLLIGLKLAIAQNAFVYHFGSKTFSENDLDHTDLISQNIVTYHNRLAEYAVDHAFLRFKPTLNGKASPQPLISVLVRTRNRPQKLHNALMSLALQRDCNYEVIVVNDGGEDVTSVVQPFESYYPIQYLTHDAPRSPSDATNTALAAMRGQYYIHLDDDDIIYPHHLAAFAHLIQQNPEARILYSHYTRVLMQEDGDRLAPMQRIYPVPWKFNADELLYSNHIVIHAALIHQEVKETIGGYEPPLEILQDWEYLIRASRKFSFSPLGRITCEYRIYSGISNSLVARRERTLNEMKEIFARYPTSNPAITMQRAANTTGLQKQVDLIKRLQQEVDQGKITRQRANAEILHQAMGFKILETAENDSA
ncbi:MAG: glycosyltransferase [Anaerolineae bacterium]|nr:glycosyltransferase [Anaerolineae bacterium]